VFPATVCSSIVECSSRISYHEWRCQQLLLFIATEREVQIRRFVSTLFFTYLNLIEFYNIFELKLCKEIIDQALRRLVVGTSGDLDSSMKNHRSLL
jgi:hypothetical protein